MTQRVDLSALDALAEAATAGGNEALVFLAALHAAYPALKAEIEALRGENERWSSIRDHVVEILIDERDAEVAVISAKILLEAAPEHAGIEYFEMIKTLTPASASKDSEEKKT